MRVSFLLAFLAIAGMAFSQNVNMNTSGTANISRCGDNVYDSGGGGWLGTYSSGESGVLVICPTTPASAVRLTFFSFDVENNNDFLTIYDGNSTAGTVLGVFTGSTSPGVIQASTGNPSGCLTLRFTSDNDWFQLSGGFGATISCFSTCQTINSTLTSTSPAAITPGNMVRACQNQSVSFTGGATFSGSSSGASYQWSFGDGTTANGTTASHSYATGGSYLVNLRVTDANGCTNNNYINQLVQISTTPVIATSATPSPLCTNQYSHLNGSVTPVISVPSCTPPVSGLTFLPDGSGASYSTTITTNCYPLGSTITSDADFVSVCLNMEHSWLNDLRIRLICPDGTGIRLHNRNGTGIYLGAPLDDPATTAGVGADYCFTPSAGTLLYNGATTNMGTPPAPSINPGNYRPVDAFSGLIGCPLNGTWTIEVTDLQGADDGYIFSWGLNLAASLTGLPSFTPTIVTQGWTPASYLYNLLGTTADVVAPLVGTFPYVYTVTDNFGCTYTQTQNVVVNCLSLPVGLVSFDAEVMSDKRVALRWVTESEENTDRFEIDRSANGQDWEFVTAAEAAGDSQEELVYSSFDQDPLVGVSYYRLRSIDKDGTQQVSDIDVVTIKPDEGVLVIYPNPAQDWITIEGNDKDLAALQLINPLGQDITAQVEKNTEAASKLQLDLAPLAKGTYMIKTTTMTYLVTKQ